ncbi:MAG: penicillin-binding protein activator [Alphaproteobacteria bacterium]|nr:penicillin-binding protein activator [Alphaproteobacteria bacterium]
MRIALLLPLSGPTGGLGRAMLDAAQLALFDVGDDNVVLLPRDTQGTADGAARAAEAALGQGAALILGPLLAGEVAAVKPIARKANVNMVAFSTDETLAGDGTYLLGFPPRQNIDRIAAFAHDKGVMRFAAIAPETPYGQLAVAELRSAAAARGASLDRVEFYDPASTDLRPVVRRLAGQAPADEPGFDAVLLPEGGTRLKAVASLLPYFDIDPGKIHLLGTGLWDEPGLGSEPALIGGWFAAPDPAGRADFEKRFSAAYKQAPPRLASLGYDAVALAAVLANKPRGTGFTTETLTDPSGFAGVDGIFRFRPDGRAERGLAVLQVEPSGRIVVSPAPQSFEAQSS